MINSLIVWLVVQHISNRNLLVPFWEIKTWGCALCVCLFDVCLQTEELGCSWIHHKPLRRAQVLGPGLLEDLGYHQLPDLLQVPAGWCCERTPAANQTQWSALRMWSAPGWKVQLKVTRLVLKIATLRCFDSTVRTNRCSRVHSNTLSRQEAGFRRRPVVFHQDSLSELLWSHLRFGSFGLQMPW